jgi:hypothetical protein
MMGRLTVSESSVLLGRLIEQARKEDEEMEALKVRRDAQPRFALVCDLNPRWCAQKAHKDRILALSRANISASAVMDPDNVSDDEGDDQASTTR